jgi:uncharacterized iron-regulated protein
MFKSICVAAAMFAACSSYAAEVYRVSNKFLASYEQLVSSLEPGTILVLGEIHDHVGHHNSHRQILDEMLAQGVSFHVGMEFFYYPDQGLVDQYLYDEVTEKDFLQQIFLGRLTF